MEKIKEYERKERQYENKFINTCMGIGQVLAIGAMFYLPLDHAAKIWKDHYKPSKDKVINSFDISQDNLYRNSREISDVIQ